MNDNLHKAKAAKNDEFYTQLSDIEKELSNYPADIFKNKIIYCPCDVGVDGLDIPKSNFVKYFEMNKERLGYKQLLHTSLQEGYDFHSDYCTRLLNEADIVVTNPPFSLFRDFFKWLMDNKKDFILWGNQNAISYAEVFPYIKDNKVMCGACITNKVCLFEVPEGYKYDEVATAKKKDGKFYGKVPAITVFTTLDLEKHHEPLLLIEKYSPEKYPKYDNYDAIEVSKITKIPCDYDGLMGVPITYLYQHNPDQFEIYCVAKGAMGKDYCTKGGSYYKEMQELNSNVRQGDALYLDENGIPVTCYARILIKRRTN